MTGTKTGVQSETLVSRLHQLTAQSSHRILLLSAAIGVSPSVRAWIGATSAAAGATTGWRAPRMLHAVYDVREDIRSVRTVARTGGQRFDRRVTDLIGRVTAYSGDGDAVASTSLVVGQVGRFGKSGEEKPTRAQQLAPLFEMAIRGGSVLSIHATRQSAELMALELASRHAAHEASPQLVRFARQRLGREHSLVRALQGGVAYHHAGLPLDVLIEIEEATRREELAVICATTSLTEGVNLPVRTVVVAEQGVYYGGEFKRYVGPAKLLNAAGRAGRAGRETEGWVVLVRQPGNPAEPAEQLASLDEPPETTSTLSTVEALADLADYEALLADSADLVLDRVPDSVDSFLSYCWYLADAAPLFDRSAKVDEVVTGLRSTLAWGQLPSELVQRWEALASRVVDSYLAADEVRRARWARTSARLSAIATLENVFEGLEAELEGLDLLQVGDAADVLDAVLAGGRLDAIMSLLPERTYTFRRSRGGRSQRLDVDIKGVVLDWVRVAERSTLADSHLGGSEADEAYNLEQIGLFIADVCEHHLPWAIATLGQWLQESGSYEFLNELPAYVRLGVSNPVAHELLSSGVRSRRLAIRLAQVATTEGVDSGGLRAWLATMALVDWVDRFQASRSEVADLLRFVRSPSNKVGARLLDGETVDIPIVSLGIGLDSERDLEVVASGSDASHQLVLVGRTSRQELAAVSPVLQHDLSMLLDAGFQVLAEVGDPRSANEASVHIRVD